MSDSDASHRSSPSAGRMRTHRERRRKGLLVVPLHVRSSEVEALVQRGLLVTVAAAGWTTSSSSDCGDR